MRGCDGSSASPFLELAKWLCFKSSEYTLPTIALSVLELAVHDRHPGHAKCLAMRDALRRELEALLGADGVLLYPSHSTVAPFHHLPLVKTLNWGYTAVFNATGHPVSQVPLGLGEEGMPLGIQVIKRTH